MRKGSKLGIFGENADDVISEVFDEHRNRMVNNFNEHENIIGDKYEGVGRGLFSAEKSNNTTP